MLASLLNIPTSSTEFMIWAFAHMDQHRKIVDAIYEQHKIALPEYILDPMPNPKDPNFGAWTYAHQSAHSDFDALLNIAGNDLTGVDFSQADQASSWIRLHADEHIQAQQVLGFSD